MKKLEAGWGKELSLGYADPDPNNCRLIGHPLIVAEAAARQISRRLDKLLEEPPVPQIRRGK